MDRFPTSRPASGLWADSCRRGRKCAPSVLLTLLLVSLLGAQAHAAPSGNLNGVDGSTIHGWAWDSALPNSFVSVDVYDGTTFLTTVVANTTGPSGGNHGFNLVTPASLKDGLTHSISVKFTGTSTAVGSSPQSYTFIPAAGVYTAGAGLTLSPAHQFSIAPGGLVQAMIANGAVTTSAIANGSVTAAKLAPGVLSPTGAAGGDLTGTYPNPIVAPNAIDHTKLANDAASMVQVSGGLVTAIDATHLNVSGVLATQNDIHCGGTVITLSGNGGGAGNNGGAARALVDDGQGELVINYLNDFGLVTVGSNLDVVGNIISLNGNARGGHNGSTTRALVDDGTQLVLNYANDFSYVTVGSGMTVLGKITSNSLQLTGGSDLAEPYKIAIGPLHPLPGMVVSIDPTHLGQMRVCTAAYDATVGGILSGANGIQPGIILRQAGTIADGTLPVASTGRVWCYCDADAGGPIHPGDLLTTSATPGHAMRARDYDKARGAILGKAMSPLKAGKGLVLVLVTLE